MLTLLTAKVDMGTYGISDRMVIGIFDNDDDIAAAIRMSRKKWPTQFVSFHSEVVDLNRFLIK